MSVSRAEFVQAMFILPTGGTLGQRACICSLETGAAWDLSGMPIPHGWQGNPEPTSNSPSAESLFISQPQRLGTVALECMTKCGRRESNPHALTRHRF